MAANLHSATGKAVDDWVEVVTAAELEGFSAIVDWLKDRHGLGHFQARLIAKAHRGAGLQRDQSD